MSDFNTDLQKIAGQPAKMREILEDLYECYPKEIKRAVHYAAHGRHLDEEMLGEALATITRYDGAHAPFWTQAELEELLKKNGITLTGQQYSAYDVNFLSQYYAADFKSLGQEPLVFVKMAIDRLHDVDDANATEAAYRKASHRIAKSLK